MRGKIISKHLTIAFPLGKDGLMLQSFHPLQAQLYNYNNNRAPPSLLPLRVIVKLGR